MTIYVAVVIQSTTSMYIGIGPFYGQSPECCTRVTPWFQFTRNRLSVLFVLVQFRVELQGALAILTVSRSGLLCTCFASYIRSMPLTTLISVVIDDVIKTYG